jgi:hypothetical protein
VNRPRLPRSRGGRLALGVATGIVLAAFVAVWAIPNVAGAAFVDVRAVAVAHASADGTMTAVGGSPAVAADRIDVSVEVVNNYPLSVVVGASSSGNDFRATVYRRDSGGRLTAVWHGSTSDPALEEGSDSPVGGSSSDVAALIAPGASRHLIAGGSSAFTLVGARGALVAPGIYYLRVSAYGIASPMVPISIG